jgi:hypothetical protein
MTIKRHHEKMESNIVVGQGKVNLKAIKQSSPLLHQSWQKWMKTYCVPQKGINCLNGV